MALDLYLVVIDADGSVVPGGSDVDRLSNPFRRNAAVVTPFPLLVYSFGAEAPVVTGGAPVGRVDVGELRVVMTDDHAAGVLFRAAATGRRFRSIDVLARQAGERPGLVAGVGVASAVLTEVSWNVSTSGIQRSLRIDGQVFSVGSAAQRPDGSYTPFAISSYDTTPAARADPSRRCPVRC